MAWQPLYMTMDDGIGREKTKHSQRGLIKNIDCWLNTDIGEAMVINVRKENVCELEKPKAKGMKRVDFRKAKKEYETAMEKGERVFIDIKLNEKLINDKNLEVVVNQQDLNGWLNTVNTIKAMKREAKI